MENLIAWILMAAVSLPISFLAARGCLRGVLRLMSVAMRPDGDRPGVLSYSGGGTRRDVL
jgi:hypothetical protein